MLYILIKKHSLNIKATVMNQILVSIFRLRPLPVRFCLHSKDSFNSETPHYNFRLRKYYL